MVKAISAAAFPHGGKLPVLGWKLEVVPQGIA